MSTPHTQSCTCGAMEWRVADPAKGRFLRCYCADCQSFANHLESKTTLDPLGGTDIFQTLPGNLSFTKGRVHLTCLRLSPRGLVRWYAGCCKTPIANTLARNKLPFVGVIAPQGTTAFGPLKAYVQTDLTKGAVKQSGFASAGFALLARGLGAKLSGQAGSLFFNADGTLVETPNVLSLEERNAARP